MEQHALEISYGLAALVSALVALVLGGIVWFVKKYVIGKLEDIGDKQDRYIATVAEEARLFRKDVTGELVAIRSLLGDEVRALREMIHDVDKRVVKIESRCAIYHSLSEEDDGK